MKYRTVSLREEVYNMIRDKARKGYRGISNQIELELMRNSNSEITH
jgi:hypothetical protein